MKSTNVEYEIFCHTSSHWGLHELPVRGYTVSGNITKQAMETDNSYAGNSAHNKGSAAIWNLKLQKWGAPLVQGANYQEEGLVIRRDDDDDDDNDNNNNNNNP